MPVAPIPITPTRLPVKSIGSLGQRAVWKMRPLNVSCPGNIDESGAESMPVQPIRNCVSIVSPVSVFTVQRPVVSLKWALVIVVLN